MTALPKLSTRVLLAGAACVFAPIEARCEERVDRRVHGMLVGGVLGDALGGPVEFASREKVRDLLPGFRDRPDTRVDATSLAELASGLPLLSYDPIRPGQEPYGQWVARAPAGTCTDDTRNKIVLIDALRAAIADGRWRPDRDDVARAYLHFDERREVMANRDWAELSQRGFREFQQSARWLLGERDRAIAAPPERLWNGIGTCCGQMTLPPLAALFPGDPEAAYLAAYEIGFFDNGEGKDFNAAIIAGLAAALTMPDAGASSDGRQYAWRGLLDAMKSTDPYRFGEIEFMQRSLNRTIDRAVAIAAEADGSPGRLYRLIERAAPREHAWEARFLLTEAVALGEFARGEPLAAIHLALDFGEDTDSAAQLLGVWFGALYGPELFPEAMRDAVHERLKADHGESLAEWTRLLAAARSERP